MTKHKWSKQQQSIFNWFESGAGNLVVRARAGTGKTTTILEGINRAPDENILLAAFNKRIADELSQRCTNQNASVKTLHALGYAFVRRQWNELGPIEVDARRTLGLLYEHAKAEHLPYIGKLPARWIASLATLMKELYPFDATQPDLIEQTGLDYGTLTDLYRVGWGFQKVLPLVQTCIEKSKAYTGKVDYADMLFLPLVLEMTEPLFDLVVVDEAQDMNRAQLDLALASCTEEGRVCVVGDDRQAIYGFRGADSGAIDRMKEQLQADELPLTETYRCPQAVVREANRLVPDLVSNKKEEGSVSVVRTDSELLKLASKGDFILSRLNAPLAHTCLVFLTNNIPARIVGRDVGEALQTHIDKQARHEDTDKIGDFLVDLQGYEVSTVRALDEADRPEAIEAFLDMTHTIRTLASEGCLTVGDLRTRIKTLFVDTPPEDMVVLSTVHKAKGLEADRVFILKHTLYNFSVSDEETNIEYVAITRAKKDLVWVGEQYGNAKRKAGVK